MRKIFLLLSLLLSISIFTQAQTISGTVSDAAGNPLSNISVIEKNTGRGTTSNALGAFQLEVSSLQATLVFSSVGYISKEIALQGAAEVNVTLDEEIASLDEVVVVGYGTQRKVNISGAVDQIGRKELEARPINNITQGLQGMMPNLNIDFPSGEPGSTANLNIRGIASINGGNPLILIDGIAASDAGELNRLLPGDIQSISILKDAASSAIYGARAAFGVILITTKQGRTEKIQVDYNNNFTWKKPSILPEKTSDPYIYMKLKNIAVLNTPWSGGHVNSDERLEWARRRSDDPSSSDPVRLDPRDNSLWEYMGNKDWTKYFLDKFTFSNAHQVSVSGKTTKTNFYMSAGVENNNGILANIVDVDNYKRYNMRLKGSYNLTDWFTLSNNTSYISTQRNKPSAFWDSNMDMFYNLAPQDHDINPDGSWANNDAGRVLASLNDGGKDLRTYDRFQSIFGGELRFFKDKLKLNANYSYLKGAEDYNWYETKYNIGYGPDDIRAEGNSRAYRTYAKDLSQILDIFATLNLSKEKHFFSSVLGFNQEYYNYNWFKADRPNLISNQLPTIALATGDPTVDESFTDWATRGYFYRLNYIYNDKYIVEFNGRYDGSSRFPSDKRFGFFPSVSIAWRVDSEKFFEPLKNTISHFKIRASYGSLGNQLVSAYGYIPTMSSFLGGYLIDGKRPQVVSSPGLVSSNYTWESVLTRNLGVDINLFNNKIGIVADIYRRDTRGMLVMGKELPAILGVSAPSENAADLKTNGWEVSLTYNNYFNIASSPLNLSAKFILSDARSWITKFDNPSRLLTQYYVGQELGEIWGLQSDGLFKTKEEVAQLDQSSIIPWGALDIVPGWPRYKDLNDDKQITKGLSVDDPKDLSVIGNNSPRLRFGFNLSANWKNIDMTLFLQGVGKRDYYPLSYLYWSFYQQPYAGGQTHIFDYYRGQADSDIEMAKHSKSYIAAGLANQNTDAYYPVLQSWLADKNLGTRIDQSMGLAIPQTRYLLNGSYLRIKNITLGYTLPSEWINRIKLSRVRLFVSADNLYEWSGVRKYFDPEAITNESAFGYVYPFNRNYVAGLNITF